MRFSFSVSNIGWLLVLLVPFTLYMVLDASATTGASKQLNYFVFLISSAVIMWVFRLQADVIPSIFLLLGFLMLGVAPASVVFSGYASETFFMALSILALSSVIVDSGLSKRVMLMAFHYGPKNKYLFSAVIFVFGLVLTPLIPTTNGRASIIAPMLKEALNHYKKNSVEHQRIVASLLGGLSLLSPAFLSAKSVNLVIWGMLSTQDQSIFNYSYWLLAALVPCVILLVLYSLALVVIFWNNDKIDVNFDLIREQYLQLPKVNKKERNAMIALFIFMLMIVTYSQHHINIPLIAFGIFFGLLFFNLLEKEDLSSSIDWSFLIFLGAVIGLSNTMQFLQMGDLIASNISWLTVYIQQNIYLFILFLSILVFIFRLFLPINACVLLLGTILVPIATIYGGSAWMIGFIILMMAESYIFPYQASYYMQCESILGADHLEALNSNRVYLINGLVFILKVIAICLSVGYWEFLGVL